MRKYKNSSHLSSGATMKNIGISLKVHILLLLGIFLSCFGCDQVSNVLTGILITPQEAAILTGNTQQYSAKALFSNNTQQDITSSVTWHVSNETIASISSSGLAKGITQGTAFVSANLGNLTSNLATLNVIENIGNR